MSIELLNPAQLSLMEDLSPSLESADQFLSEELLGEIVVDEQDVRTAFDAMAIAAENIAKNAASIDGDIDSEDIRLSSESLTGMINAKGTEGTVLEFDLDEFFRDIDTVTPEIIARMIKQAHIWADEMLRHVRYDSSAQDSSNLVEDKGRI